MDPGLRRQWKEHIESWWRDVPTDTGDSRREIAWVEKGEGPPSGEGWALSGDEILPVAR